AAFFLEIQGSGRVKMTDGSVARIGYDAQNGRPYVPIGRVLAEAGALERPVTMAKIRRWLAAHPQQAQEILNRNPSVVFFRLHKDSEGPKGAQGVSLTPLRSLAVDPSFVSLGTPLWLETRTDEGEERRLVIAQDTGGAIKGALRGDLFCGAGAEAEAKAGALQARGIYYVLLPKGEPVP
ncbi:MAG: murein transglycosylase, partial [Alphaproteobacteria bacterium]|nr:murein transglycosylase [Alphaproteobacteria bacterium]